MSLSRQQILERRKRREHERDTRQLPADEMYEIAQQRASQVLEKHVAAASRSKQITEEDLAVRINAR